MKKVMVLSLLFLFYFNAPAHAGWISTATKAGKVAKKAADAALDATGKVITAPLKFALDPHGFIVLNSATRHIRSARDSVRDQIKCEKIIKLKSNLTAFEKPNINSPQRLIFQQGEAVCVKSETFGWTKTPFGWINVN